jgi:CRP-like cAMP-binding protein
MLNADVLNGSPTQPRVGPRTGPLARNRILLDMPADLQRAVLARAEHVRLRPRQIVEEIAMPVRYVHFIENGRVSLMGRSEPGKTVETGMLDDRDLVGLPLVLGEARALERAVVQTPGEALRIAAGEFVRLVASIPDLRRQLLLYVNKRFARTTQTALCNAHHTLHQRVARWLCWAVEGAVEAEELCLTHDQLARNLGVRRATVSEILADLEAQRMLKRGRGSLLVYPERLEQAACSCLRMLRRTQTDPEKDGERRPAPFLCG